VTSYITFRQSALGCKQASALIEMAFHCRLILKIRPFRVKPLTKPPQPIVNRDLFVTLPRARHLRPTNGANIRRKLRPVKQQGLKISTIFANETASLTTLKNAAQKLPQRTRNSSRHDSLVPPSTSRRVITSV